jgi:hypothetical protein
MTKRQARRIRRKANAWARETRRLMLHRGEGKRRQCTTAELRRWAREWPWFRTRARWETL